MLIFAISTEIISAGSALIGVIVGAVTGGAIEWQLERRRERFKARAAARLLRADIAIAVERLDDAVKERVWFPFYDLSFSAWDTYRDLLAGALSAADDWLTVSQGVIELQEFGRHYLATPVRQAPGYLDGVRALGDAHGIAITTMRENVVKSFNVLCELADDPDRLEALAAGSDSHSAKTVPHKTTPAAE